MFTTDTNTARLEDAEDLLDELEDRIAAQHRAATERHHDRIGGDPAKLLDDKPSQAWQIVSAAEEDDEALGLADLARDALAIVRRTLDQIGPPAIDIFDQTDAALWALTTHVDAIDDASTGDDEIEED